MYVDTIMDRDQKKSFKSYWLWQRDVMCLHGVSIMVEKKSVMPILNY